MADQPFAITQSFAYVARSYQEQFRETKEKLAALPKSRQFDFSVTKIFGKFDLFCRRVIKLLDMFSTIEARDAAVVCSL